jgi:signal transduction histidine kinase
MTEPLPLPRAINPDIPEAVERVILKALAREPQDRFASAGVMAEALKKAVSEPNVGKQGNAERSVPENQEQQVDEGVQKTVAIAGVDLRDTEQAAHLNDLLERSGHLRRSINNLARAVEIQRRSLRQLRAAVGNSPYAQVAQLVIVSSVNVYNSALQISRHLPVFENALNRVWSGIKAIEKENDQLRALSEVGTVINSTLDSSEVLNRVMDQAIEITGAERGYLVLRDEETGELQFRVARNLDRETLNKGSFQVSKTIVNTVAETGEPVVTTNAQADPRFRSQESVISYTLRSILCVPLRIKGQIIGAVYADNRIKSGLFRERELPLWIAFANQAAVAFENAQAYSKLDELDKVKNKFLSTVSHELRTPLTPVQSCVENMLSGLYGPLTDKQRSRLESALASVREERRLIENLLDLVRIQENAVTVQKEHSSIAKVIDDVTRVFEYDASQERISLIVDLPDGDPLYAHMDVGKVKQVLTNLVSNALKFTPQGGSITIAASDVGQEIEVRVEDTGIGIAEEEYDRIFARFYQIDSSSTRRVGGTGIGLNVVKEYVELHKGRVWVESEVGRGSIFFFTLPKDGTGKEKSQ